MSGWLGSGVKGKMDRIFKPSPGKILVSDKLGNAVESNKTVANLLSELEEDSKIGTLSNLTTEEKSNLVTAINELNTIIRNIDNALANSTAEGLTYTTQFTTSES